MFSKVLIFIVAVAVLASALPAEERPTWPRPTRTPRPTTQPTTVRPPPDVIATECGGIVEGASGQISYKFGENLAQNEICVWTIRSPGTGAITLQLEEDGLNQSENTYISILTVGNEATLQKSHKFVAQDRDARRFEGQVGYVVFRTGSNVEGATGFKLYFAGQSDISDESLWTGGNKTHVHFHLNRGNQGYADEFFYPNPRAMYQPNEFGSWVLNPEGTKMLNTLYLNYIDFEDFSCYDFIKIHQVDGDSVKLLDKKCNTNTHFSGSFNYKTVKEPFIVTMNTNYKNERTGFILYYGNDKY